MKEFQYKDTFKYSLEEPDEYVPKLSIHYSGQVHIRACKKDEILAGPLFCPPLNELNGEHIATICVDRFDGLLEFKKSPRQAGPEIDHVIPVGDGVKSGRLAIYINGNSPIFGGGKCRIMIPRNTIYIGVKPISQLPLGSPKKSGIIVIAGWDPTKKMGVEQDYLYIRGE